MAHGLAITEERGAITKKRALWGIEPKEAAAK